MIVVSGASGVVGGHVIEALSGRYPGRLAILARENSCNRHPTLPRLDLGALEGVGGPVSLVHLASPRSQQFDEVVRDEMHAMVRLLELRNLARVVFASTQAVYGPPTSEEHGHPVAESAVLHPTCWYDIGKAVNEYQLSMRHRADRSFKWVGLRFGLLLDAGGLSRGPLAQFLPQILGHYLESGVFYLSPRLTIDKSGSSYSSGSGLGHAFADCLNTDYCGPLNFASGYFTWRKLLDVMHAATGRPYRVVTQRSSEAYPLAGGRFELDCALARKHLTAFAERGIAEIVGHAFAARAARVEPANAN